MEKQKKRKPQIILFLLVIFALAFSLRLVYMSDLMASKIFPVLESSDSSAYYNWGRDIASGDIVGYKAFMKWPLYAYCLGAWFKVFGTNLALVFYLQFLLGSLNCILVFFIARKLFNTAVAYVSSLLCLFYGLFVFYDGLIMYTNLSLALNLLFLLYLLGISDRPDGAKLFFCGIFLGICVITQGSILLFGVIAVAWIISRSTKDRPLLVKRMLVFLSGLLIVIAATTLRNHLSENDFVPVAGNLGFNFYSGNNPQSTGTFFSPENITLNQEDMFRDSRIIAEAAEGKKLKTSRASAFWMRKSMDYAYHNPLDFSRKFIKKIFLLFSPKEYVHDIEYNLISLRSVALKIMFKDMKYIMPFVLIGLFIGIKELKKNALLYLYIVTFVFSIAVFFVTARYRLMLVPVFMIFAAVAIDRFICYFRSRQWRSLKILCVIWIGVFIVLNYTNLFALPIKTGANTAAFEYHMANALMHEKNSDYSPALLELELANRLEPYNRRAISRQGLIYFKLGKLDMAVKCYQMAIKASPLSVDAYFNLGLIYNQQARFAEAKEMLFKAISLDPYDFKAHFELGRAFAAANDKKMAKDEFDLALKYINRWRKLDIEIINRESAAL